MISTGGDELICGHILMPLQKAYKVRGAVADGSILYVGSTLRDELLTAEVLELGHPRTSSYTDTFYTYDFMLDKKALAHL